MHFLNHLLYIIEHPWDYFDKILNKIVNILAYTLELKFEKM